MLYYVKRGREFYVGYNRWSSHERDARIFYTYGEALDIANAYTHARVVYG